MNAKVNLDFLKNVPIKVPKIKSRKIFNGKAGSQNHLDVQQPSGVIHRTPSKISTISSLVDGAPHYDYSFGPSSLSNDCEIRSDYEPSAVHSTLNRSRSSADVDQIGSSKKSLSLPQRLSKQYKGLSEFKIKHFWAKKTVVKKTEIDVMSYAYSLDSDERGSIRSDQDVEFHHIRPGPSSRSNSGSDISSIVGESRPPKLAEIRKQSQQSQQSQLSGISDNLSIGKIRPNQSTLFGRLHRKSTEEKTVPSRTGSLEKANSHSDEKPFKGLTGLNNIYDKARKKMSSKIQKFKAKRQESTASDTQNPKTLPSPDMPAGSGFEKRGSYIKPSAFRISRDSDEDYMPPESYIDSRRTYTKPNAFRTSGDSDDSYIPPETSFDDKTTYLKSSAFRTSKDSDNSYSSNPKSISGYHVNEEPKIFGPARRKQWNLGTQSQFSAESEERVPPKCLQEQPPLDESDEWLRRMGAGSTPKVLQSQSSSESGRQIQVSRPAPPLPRRDIRPQWAQWGESNTTVADVHRAGQSRNWSQSMDSNGSDAWIPEQFRKKGSKTSSQEEDAWRAFGSKPSSHGTNFNLLQKRKSIDIFLNGDQQAFDDFDNCLENVPIIQVTEASPTNIDENKRRASITKQEKVVGDDIPPVTGAAKNVNSLINQFEQPSSENDGVLSFDENESLVVLDGSLLWNDTELNGQTVDEEGNVVLARPVSPSPSRLSQTLRTTILPESIPSCSYSRNGAISPIITSRTSSSESASSTDVQTCIENTINMGLHSDIPFSFHSPSGSRRALVNNEVNANSTPHSNICNGMRRYDTLEDLNKTDLLGSKSSLVESDDNSYASLETAKSKDTTDSSDFKSISTTYSGQDRSPVKTTVTTQPKIPPPVMPKPRGKCPLAPPVQKMMAPPPPVPIHKSSVEVKEESSLKITQTPPPTGKRAVFKKMEPQQILPATSPQQTNTKTEPSIPLPVNRLRVQDGYQKAPRKSPRKVKTLSMDSETTRVKKSNGPTASTRNLGTRSLEGDKQSLQEADIFYSLEKDDEVLQQVQQLLAQQSPITGDQILALKSNLSAVPAAPIGSSDYIDEPSDEVLLHLVRHLASLKQQQHSTSDKEQQKNLQNLNKHRLPTVPCDIKALEESIDKYLNLNSFEEDESEDLPEGHPERVDRPDLLLLSDEDISLRTESETDTESDIASIITAKRRGSECLEESGDHLAFHDVRDYSFDSTDNNRNDAFQYSNNTQENSDKINNNIGSSNCSNDQCKREDGYNTRVVSYSNELSGEPTTTTTTSEEKDQNLVTDCNMGSNVSRNSGKGLSGRRTQSSGNLYSGKHQNGPNHTPSGKHSSKQNAMTSVGDGGEQDGSGDGVGNGKHHTIDGRIQDVDDSHQSEACPTQLMMGQLCTVTQRDRNKFCGSLPNHLDSEDVAENDTLQSNNYTDTSDRTDRLEYVTVAPRRQPYPPNQQQQFTQQHSPYNNSVSEKETASTSSGSSTFKINQDKPDIQLKLPLTRSNFDPSCDQGYGSERSPEDEIPPPMPNMLPSPYQQLLNPVEWDYDKYTAAYTYNFITKDCTFCVPITKGPRGLGLSISGGIDSNAAFPGLIRVKRLFPHQAAWSTGKLQPGDIILEVNGVSLTGLTNYEALEVLRTMPNEVVLLVCRPTDEQYRKLSPPTEPPKPPQRTQQQATQATQTLPDETYPLQPLAPLQTNFNGEFEIIMVKQQGSLGFTLRKEDESVLGHYVRALVREPATTDGRIKPGDKIVAVNDVPLSPMTHEEAVIFLRQAADTVKLRLYRDEAQTPVAAMSPNSSENKTICGSGKKPFLRPEAINLLSDLAYKKQIPTGDSTESSIKSNNTSPRRLRRGNKQQSNSGNTSTSEVETTDSKSSSNQQYLVSSQTTSVCSDSEQSMVSQCSYIVQAPESADSELFKMPDDEDRPDRPNFLDLAGQSGSTPVVSRKPRFQFTVASNAYELNNLDNDALDAPIYTGNENGSESADSKLPDNHEFTSLPCETFLIACKTESDLKNEANFSHKNPLYQSAHVQVPLTDEAAANLIKKEGNKSLLKWKGVMFSPDDEGKNTPEATDSSSGATIGTNPTPRTESDFDVKEFTANSVEGHKVVSVELNRGWNSRLGFSLQPDPATKKTVISAIYNDSVAAKDGRLRVGDQLVTVNDELVENMPTSDIIDLLRIIRGLICITVLRKDPNPKT